MNSTTASPDAVEPDVDTPPKLPPDDPTLQLRSGKRLNPKAVAAAAAATVLAIGLLAALTPGDDRAEIVEEPKPAKIPRALGVPQFLEEAPAAPAPRTVPAAALTEASSLSPVPPAPAARIDRFRTEPVRDREREQEAELEERARSAGVFFSASDKSNPPSEDESGRGGAARDYYPPGAPPPAAPSLAAAGALPATWDPNLQDHKNEFLRSRPRSPDYLRGSLQRPISRYELKASSIIPVTLISGLNSDLPGPVTAQVRERVFDTVTGDHVLIPQGARLFGWYDSKVAWGQERVLLCWDRIIFPNGNSINLECMPAGDLTGQAGLTDEVDHHLDRLMAAVGLSTILSVGAQAVAGDTTGEHPTLAQSAARNAAGQINSAGQAYVGRQLNIQPTITVRPGFAANLLVTKDIVLEPYVESDR